ncbi:ATP-dependent RecD-like DNA helicase [Lederbergia sp. NSJ-179]|uniref:SF1B family DNA helicase RecD2 n=1 Tax=Lederbergia sp. NSJ-179 TaxID=2931402 RepID=UPI001FD4A3CD|nr:ATP-dependent RecD-like DNA helicase [Lederbergia sp. NSJ-179]MCJ7841781.1 ATP-dependent RecD-like DNA helicase [Lederbergia sp. NSJ-179]
MDVRQNSLDLFSEQEKYIQGRHLVTIFHNEQNFYSVVRIRVEKTDAEIKDKEAVIVGHFPKLQDEESYVFYGQMKEHPKFGHQFNAKHFKKVMPQTKQGIVAYLSSELFKGIGKKTAERIVDVLGENAISRILDQPSLLDSVPKLGSETAKDLYETLMEHQGLERIMVGLNQYGFGPQISMKIYQVYKEETLTILEKNPYQLIEDVEGIGFGRADELGSQLGITGNHPDRIKAGCLYMLEQDCLKNGHVYLESAELLEKVKGLLEESQNIEIPYENIAEEIINLEEEGKIIGEEKRIYLPSLYFAEKGIVTNLNRVMKQTEYADQFPESEFLLALGKLEERLNVQYAPSQREAIQTALTNPMMILTGGPGTGKTTVIKGIVELYAELHGCSLDPHAYKKEEPFPILLTAPTGRAAKRMSESTELPAMTIHRLLGMTAQENLEAEGERELEGKLIIVDEMSMVDTWLAHQLFKALPSQIQVILVGDEDQLPSVGPGQVLKDLLRSKVVPVVQLTDIYRQEEGSSIIELAHQVKKGEIPQNLLKPQKDRSFIQCQTDQMGDVIKKIVLSAKKKGYTAMDVQVLAPMYRGAAGIDALNQILQAIFNPNEDRKRKELSFGETKYRIGDKILQLVNQPEKNVFNGDIGEIISILTAKENTEKQDMVIASFEGTEVAYTRSDLNQITLAYCCSIHKSQGSEFPIVIMPVVRSYYRMLRRNLLYTGLTRSKKSLVLCGEEQAFQIGIKREDDQQRKTSLYEKLITIQSQVEKEEAKVEGLTEETFMLIDPMIGMENVTPYDFMEMEGK